MADLVGQMDRRLRVLKAQQVQDPTNGEVTTSWITVATVWAARKQLSGREVEIAAATKGAEELRFRIRYRTGIDTTARLECEGVTFAITRIEEISRRRWLDLYARRI